MLNNLKEKYSPCHMRTHTHTHASHTHLPMCILEIERKWWVEWGEDNWPNTREVGSCTHVTQYIVIVVQWKLVGRPFTDISYICVYSTFSLQATVKITYYMAIYCAGSI